MAVVVFFGVSGFSLAEPDDTSPMQESTPTEATEVS